MRILITAGPTREPIDPVRFLSNRSSGKMGYALASAARDAGVEVVLISGPVAIEPPEGVEFISVESAADMHDAVAANIGNCEAAIFAAAVADYRVADVATSKIKKSGESLSLTLIPNPDILGSARESFQFEGVLVGFAAETDDLIANARSKLDRKGCDLVVANDVGRSDIGFDQDANEVVLLFRDGREEALPRASKRAIAGQIIEAVESMIRSRE